MITAAMLKERRLAAKHGHDAEFAQTEQLKSRLARARDKRVPFYLTREEFLAICRWKAGDQYSRSALLLESNSENRVKRTTRLAFAVKDKDADFVLAGRLTILGLLPGVGTGLASAILALCYPKRFAAIDARLWSALFDQKKSTFGPSDYQRCLTRLEELTDEVRPLDPKGRWSVQSAGFFGARGDRSAT